MRPRVFPAEDAVCSCSAIHCETSFNEAAGIPRGRLLHFLSLEYCDPSSFNEAAGIPRGRPLLLPCQANAVIPLQ